MPSLSNIPGFTALSTSSDPHAAWPAQAGSYNAPGDGTTPLTNPTTSDGNGTAYVGPNTIYVGRGNNSGNVKGCNTIVCYGVWQGTSKASTGWPNNYMMDQFNKADCLYIFTVNTSTGAITLSFEDKNITLNAVRSWARSLSQTRLQFHTTPGIGSLVQRGYGTYSNGWSWNNIPSGEGAYMNMKMNTSGTDTLWSANSANSWHNYENWKLSHCPKNSGGNTDVFHSGHYNPNSSWPYQQEYYAGSVYATASSYYRNSVWSSLQGSSSYSTHIWNTQPDGATGGAGDINSIVWSDYSSYGPKVLHGDCIGGTTQNTNYKKFTPTESDWDDGNYRYILDTYGSSAMFQKSGSTFGAWRHCGDNSCRPMSDIDTALWDITPKSWQLPESFFDASNSNACAGIENDTWVSGSSNGRPFYYYNYGQEGFPFVKWEIDDTTGVKVVGTVMPPKFEYSGNSALGSSNNPETTNGRQHMFPIWNNSYDNDPSWVVVVFWTGGGDEYGSGTLKGRPGTTQPVLRCYPWPTFTSQNIPV